MQEKYGLSVHHACRIIGQYRGSQRDVSTVPADEDAWTRALVALAFAYGRYGSRRVTALLQAGRWARTGSSASGVERCGEAR